MSGTDQDLQVHKGKKLAWTVGLAVFFLECAAGYYYNVYVGYYHGDGISRVANAFYVLYSRNPHLGAIGFVWNPLPSLMDLPFLLLYPWIPAMAAKGIAGLLMCAIFAALTAGVVARAFLKRGLPGWSAVVFSLLFALNPMIFIFGFNGMSDAPFMFFLMASILCFLNWLDANKTGELAIAAFALAFAFWCRYEAVPFGFSMILGTLIAVMLYRKYSRTDAIGARVRWSRAEGALLIIALPLLYSCFLWIFMNAVIMGNPFNFLNGEYTNVAQIEGHLSEARYAALLGNPLNSLIFASKKVLVFSSLFIAILILKLLNRRIFKWDTLILIGMFLSIPMLQVLMLLKGMSLGWLRYFIYVLPVSFAWLPYELSKIKRKWHISIPLVAMAVNFGILSYAITQPSIAPDENTFLQNSFGRHTQVYYDWKNYTAVAEYLDENYPASTILTDSFSAFFIILQSRYPGRFYITSDNDFKKAVSNPKEYGVDYLLVPKTGSSAVLSAINDAYPNLFEHGSEWTEIARDFGSGWKLYRVTESTKKTAR